jgi:hypothetical protein
MSKAGKLSHFICFLAIIIFLWSYFARPGSYYGHINGSVTIPSREDARIYGFCYIRFTSETKPKWEWTEPNNFRYGRIDLTINDKSKTTVLFPSLTCEHGGEEHAFSKPFLIDLLTANSEVESDTITPEQSDALFNFILSAGDGTLPPPRHHPYYLESPYRADFTHFLLGGSGTPILGVIALAMLAIGIILRFLGTPKNKHVSRPGHQQQARYGISPVVIVVSVNYGSFLLGVYLNNFGGAIDEFGAFLCRTTCIIGTLVIPVSIVYSFVRRFATRIAQWDFLGAYLSILSYFVMMLFIRIPPWVLIV